MAILVNTCNSLLNKYKGVAFQKDYFCVAILDLFFKGFNSVTYEGQHV